MTNYSAWDSKATALLREAEEQDAVEEAENNSALGLQDGPKGPATVKAESELQELSNHSSQRKEFIDWSKQREVTFSHKAQEAPLEIEGPEFENKALRIQGSEDSTYIVPENSHIVKLILEGCKRVQVRVLGSIITSTIEAVRCDDVTLKLGTPIGTVQIDECVSPLRVQYAEYDHIGRIYHTNSPGLSLGWGSLDGDSAQMHNVGMSGDVQLCTRVAADDGQNPLLTAPVQRGEGEFPIEPSATQSESTPAEQADNAQKANAKRQAGNDMFRASDFMQAAMEYTSSLELDPTIAAVWSNRSQCWLKLGDHQKALADAQKVTDLDPSNAKGWFRQGISLHAMKSYREAIVPLLEAEKLEPNNKQIIDSIKMAQLMARRQAGGA